MPILTIKTRSRNEIHIPFRSGEDAQAAYDVIREAIGVQAPAVSLNSARGQYSVFTDEIDIVLWEDSGVPDWLIKEQSDAIVAQHKANFLAQSRLQSETIVRAPGSIINQ
jgi:hypothetical protein